MTPDTMLASAKTTRYHPVRNQDGTIHDHDARAALTSGPEAVRRGESWGDDHNSADDDNGDDDDTRKKSLTSRIKAAVWSYRSLLDVALLLLVLGLVLDRARPGSAATSKCSFASQHEGAGDITGFAPKMSQQIKTFSPDHAFMPDKPEDFFSKEVEAKWLSIVPKGLGYLHIADPSQHPGMPTPLRGYPNATFTTSVTHQLHCLHALAAELASLRLGSSETSSSSSSERQHPHPRRHGDDDADGSGAPWHLDHCVDYLRQAVMCAGDVALEGQQTTFPAGFIGSDGWDARHVCKDYSEVLAYLERERADDLVWI